ncbi:MAG: MCE family protein [Aquificota bacterium]|nr:MAG: MCE family protein [Aquificota bacterium]
MAFIILTFGEVPFFKTPTKTYRAYFDEVGGLSMGAEVRVAGIKSGKVKSLAIKDGKVEVVFEVNKDIELYRDAQARIGTLGLMGDKYLEIVPGSPQAGLLKEGEVIKSVKSYADTDRLINEMTLASERVKILAENLNTLVLENRESLKSVLKNLEILSANLNLVVLENREALKSAIKNIELLSYNLNRTLPKTIESIDALAKNLDQTVYENRQDIRETVANLRQLSKDLRETYPELAKNLNELAKNLNELVVENRQNLAETTRNLSESTKKLNIILSKIERGEGTIGKLVQDDELYRNLTAGTRALSKTAEVAERTNLYIGFRGELYRGGDSKGVITLRLQPDAQKYYLLELVGDSRGRVYREEILPNQEVVKKEFKPEVTLQYARVFPFMGKELVVRGGLKESTGGVGVDFVYSPSITFSADLWDFGRKDRPLEKNLKPNLQVGVSYRVGGPLYVRFGGDDLLNSRLRGAFGGVGLLFTDNDLKYLLGGMRLPLP